MRTNLCGTLPCFNHLEQGHILYPILLMMAIHPANARAPPCSHTFGLVSERLLPFPGRQLGRKMVHEIQNQKIQLKKILVMHKSEKDYYPNIYIGCLYKD